MSRSVRVYVPLALAPGAVIDLPEPAHRHLVRVLRMGDGDTVVLFNGDGREYPARLCEVERRRSRAELLRARACPTESPLELVLALCLTKGDRTDWALQKATELGVQRIVPVIAERTVVRLHDERGERKREHWRGVLIAACEQCGRSRVPELLDPVPITALGDAARTRHRWMPDPGAPSSLHAQRISGSVCLLIGPEGGFSEGDRAAAQAQGFEPVSLGPRVLRAETAAVAAVALLQATAGDLA